MLISNIFLAIISTCFLVGASMSERERVEMFRKFRTWPPKMSETESEEFKAFAKLREREVWCLVGGYNDCIIKCIFWIFLCRL